MKLRTRFEHFLAKIAGENVDIETLTPPRPVNTTEELMLKIAGKQLPMVLRVSFDGEQFVSNYTVDEVKTAMSNGIVVIGIAEAGSMSINCGCATTYMNLSEEEGLFDNDSPAFLVGITRDTSSETETLAAPFIGVRDGAFVLNA